MGKYTDSRIDQVGRNGNDGLHYSRAAMVDGVQATLHAGGLHFNQVQHPEHYTKGEIECIDCIKAALTPEEFRGFCKGNVIKYVYREAVKQGDVSLEKAMWYIETALRSKNGGEE